MRISVLLFYVLLFSFTKGSAQNNVRSDSSATIQKVSSLNAASNKLLQSIKENRPAEEIAGDYFSVSKELIKTGDFSKAEFYLNKAIQSELASLSKKNIGSYYRELAIVLELQNKITLAIESYEKATSFSDDPAQKQLNKNDALRLAGKSSPENELLYLNQNSTILSNTSNNSEKLRVFTQMAAANKALNQNESALKNYQAALNTVDSNSENSILIKSDIVNLMAASHDIENAISLQKEVVDESKNSASTETQVKQLRNLSTLYFTKNNFDAGLATLQDAYNLALKKGNLKEAKASLVTLAAVYEKNKDNKKVLSLYREFINQLEPLVAKDSSLMDRSLLLINEGKIYELEQQQVLKDELIKRKNKYNYALIGSLVLLMALLALIIKAWFSIRKRTRQLALQSLRREMNPHFIFNSLNSVNQFIASNNELEANKYLTSYSSLMRNIMENSNKDYVTLDAELEQLKKYLELEKLRFHDKFEYEIEIDPDLKVDSIKVPNMLIQPNLENAIWHGLRYKESKGLLKLKFTKTGKKINVFIDDNGIGLRESERIKTKNQKLHESLGLKNIRERIQLLNDIYKSDIRFEIAEKTATEGGVLIKIEW